MACVNVVAADNDKKATLPATSLQQLFIGVIYGKRKLLQPPLDDFSAGVTTEQATAVKHMLSYSFTGDATTLENRVKIFLEQTGVNEIMATSHIFHHTEKLLCYEIFGEVMRKL